MRKQGSRKLSDLPKVIHEVETSPAFIHALFIKSEKLLDPNFGTVRNAESDGQEVEKQGRKRIQTDEMENGLERHLAPRLQNKGGASTGH